MFILTQIFIYKYIDSSISMCISCLSRYMTCTLHCLTRATSNNSRNRSPSTIWTSQGSPQDPRYLPSHEVRFLLVPKGNRVAAISQIASHKIIPKLSPQEMALIVLMDPKSNDALGCIKTFRMWQDFWHQHDHMCLLLKFFLKKTFTNLNQDPFLTNCTNLLDLGCYLD